MSNYEEWSLPEVVEGCYSIQNGVVSIPISLMFTGTPNVSAAVIGESLIAFDRCLRIGAGVFTEAAGVKSKRKTICVVKVDELRRGSLLERLIVDIVLGGDEKAHQLVQGLLLKASSMDSAMVPKVITGLSAAVLTAGGLYAIKRYKKNKKEPQAMINAHNCIILNLAGNLKEEPSFIKELLHKYLFKQTTLPRSAVKAVQPGLSSDASDLLIGEGDFVERIPITAIRELPTLEEIEEGEEMKTQPFTSLELIIAASDKDKQTSGWAAILPEDHAYPHARVKLELAEAISPLDLMYKKQLLCDGELYIKIDRSKNTYKPSKILLTSFSSL